MRKLNRIFYIPTFAIAACLGMALTSCSKSNDDTSPKGGQSVDVETEAPSISILSPTSEEAYVTIDDALLVSGSASDNNVLQSITYKTNTGLSGEATGLEEWSISNLNLPLGDNLLEVTATDKSDNKTSASITITRNKYLTFLGIPYVDNNVIYTNQSNTLWITTSIAANNNLVASSVRLIEVDENNKEVAEVCKLYDDGDLTNHGDEIKGDNVFSIKQIFTETTPGTKRYRISAMTNETEGQVEGFSAVFKITMLDQQEAEQKVQTMMDTQKTIESKVTDVLNSSVASEEQANQIITTLKTLPNIQTVENEGSVIKVTHTSGMESYVMMNNPNYRGGTIKNESKGRYATPMIPLRQQTRGIHKCLNVLKSPFSKATTNTQDNIIQNKRVLIWAPFADKGVEAMKKTVFENSAIGLQVETITNDQCTLESLENLCNYGIIVLDTHGANGDLLMTRDKADFTQVAASDDVKDYISGMEALVTTCDGTFSAATAKFIQSKLKSKLPNSVIFNSSCEGLKTESLANSFIAMGAKTYVGFSSAVSNADSQAKETEFFNALVGDNLKTTGDSYIYDESLPNYVMRGSKDMHFYLGLINGDFEFGNMNGWNVNGDGRNITQLGSLEPTQGSYMGIVSTGLGYTTNYGSISQTFRVATNEKTLTVKWNYISEEFLEYVGSQYQDYLKISIVYNGQSTVLFKMAIDDFYNQYYNTSYSLPKVSPEIVFDRGDAYMTGWKVSTFDISAFAGKTVTLVIESGDVGDSIYDSAALLDEISVN